MGTIRTGGQETQIIPGNKPVMEDWITIIACGQRPIQDIFPL